MRSDVYDMNFRIRSRRIQGWGVALLAIAAVLWAWCGVLLAAPYEAERAYLDPTECEARLTTEWGTVNNGKRRSPCGNERDWPEAVAVLGLSVPVAVVGAMLFTSGAVRTRMSEHAAEIARLNDAVDRSTRT
ncbi:hypothetical protein ABZ070_14325 [Streptomyces sp. NPDC006283]|uniref:hypothetical protein n=1 Tax=Streptomyces sp. NPDC006283 TaxID=3156741 RepID=UPI0033AA4BDC